MDNTELAWAAALLEGEGCIYVKPRKALGLGVALCSTDRSLLERFARIFDLTITIQHTNWKYRTAWQCRTEKAAKLHEIFLALEPYMTEGSEKQQALEAGLMWLQTVQIRGKRLEPWQLKIRQTVDQKLRMLHA